MEGAGFRSLIIFLLLAILAFVAGSLASENAVGALAPTAVILGLFFLIYLGKNCWILVFIVPPVLSTIDLSILRGFPVAFMVCGVVLVYMLLLSMMGYLKLKWNYVPIIDYITLVLCIYFLSTWVRHPVEINAFVSITDFGEDSIVGGKEYIWCIGAIVCYVALSLVPIQLSTLLKIMKWTFWLSFIATCFMCAKGLIIGNVNIGEEAANTRFGAFSGVGRYIVEFVFAKYSFVGVILSPWKLLLVLLGLLGIALGGFRSAILGEFQFVFLCAWAYRQLTILLVGCFAVWGTLVYLSYEREEIFEDMPHGVKRVISAVPGVDFTNDKAEKDAEGSSEWRFKMWEWALDPSKGYITDYVWGDGFGFSLKTESLRRVSFGLGLRNAGDNTVFAERGDWHNGAIAIIQATGYVGLSIVIIWMIPVIWLIFSVCHALRKRPMKEYIFISMLPVIINYVSAFYMVQDYIALFNSFYHCALLKSIYVNLRNEGIILPRGSRVRYTPMLLRES